jgi:peptidoglycan hydrolase-like protein with peptidoglycan-binding domain
VKEVMMQVREAPGRATFRRRQLLVVAVVVVLVGVVIGLTVFSGNSGPPSAAHKGSSGHSGGGATTVPAAKTFDVESSSPSAGEADVASDTTITVTFSSAIKLGSVTPTLDPPVAGTWVQSDPTTIAYNLAAPLIPLSSETVTIPSGLRDTDGDRLKATTDINFTVIDADTSRLQQLLAELDFLPLSFTPTGAAPAAKDMTETQPGNFAWRWSTLPAALTSQWTVGMEDEITKAAVEAFENQNGLTVDGEAGPAVWSALLKDIDTHKVDDVPYVYVLVNKVQPENLTLYNDGSAEYSGILINSGAPGADTTDGTYAVFEHVVSSDMKGTNPDGSKYNDPDVPWASYFNGGDALHGFVRAHYGYPQSNGCIEMPVAEAALVWPLTPIGTLVTIEGPASPPLPPTPTTTTTAPTTTTTVAPPTTTTTAAP